MVDISGSGGGGPIAISVDNAIFIIPAIIIIALVSFFTYKLVMRLRDKERKKEEKKKLKQQRKEKENQPKKKK